MKKSLIFISFTVQQLVQDLLHFHANFLVPPDHRPRQLGHDSQRHRHQKEVGRAEVEEVRSHFPVRQVPHRFRPLLRSRLPRVEQVGRVDDVRQEPVHRQGVRRARTILGRVRLQLPGSQCLGRLRGGWH